MRNMRLAPRWSGPPLALQITGLLLGGLVVAQLVTLALTLLLPPEPQPQYDLGDIARTLMGDAVEPRAVRPLERRLQATPPEPTGPGWLTSPRSRRELADLLARGDSDVRLYFYTPLPFAGTATVLRRDDERDPPPRIRGEATDSMPSVLRAGFLLAQGRGGGMPPGGASPGGGFPGGGFPGGGGLPGGGFPGPSMPRSPWPGPAPVTPPSPPPAPAPAGVQAPGPAGGSTAPNPAGAGMAPTGEPDGGRAVAPNPAPTPAGDAPGRSAGGSPSAGGNPSTAGGPAAADGPAARAADATTDGSRSPGAPTGPAGAGRAGAGPGGTSDGPPDAAPAAADSNAAAPNAGSGRSASPPPRGATGEPMSPAAAARRAEAAQPRSIDSPDTSPGARAPSPAAPAPRPDPPARATPRAEPGRSTVEPGRAAGQLPAGAGAVPRPSGGADPTAAPIDGAPVPAAPVPAVPLPAVPAVPAPAVPETPARAAPVPRPPATAAPRSADEEGMPAAPPRGLFGWAAAPYVQGDFVAAVHLAEGSWAVVQPKPEPFPNAWQRRVLLWFAIAALLVAPLGWLFSRRIVRPLSHFADAAERLGRDPAAATLELEGPAEVGRAAQAFNRMQSRLRSFVADRTAMIGAISHDLRTPLTRMRFRIEDLDERQRDGMLNDVEEMEHMINDVLAFIHEASEPGSRERLDLASVVEDVVEDAVFVGNDVRLERSEQAPVEADAIGMRRLLGNLIENAVKYGERAEVRLYTEEQDVVAEIADHGPGLPDEELERVFQPFYRSAQARASRKAGSGLGLAVCRSIARAHGGDVRLVREKQGLVAQVRLPLAYGATSAR